MIRSSQNRHPSITVMITRAGAALSIAIAAVSLSGCTYSYEFDAVTLGDDEAGRAPEPRTNSQFVRAVYTDVVGRAPDVYEFALLDGAGNELGAFPIQEQLALVSALDATGDPDALRALVTAGLVASAEVSVPEKGQVADPSAFIRERFRTLLGRDPNTYEAFAFEDAWQADEATGPRTVIRAILGSREYQSR